MFFVFPLLILIISTLLAHLIYKNKTDQKIEDMTTELLRVNEEKTAIETKYNKILSDISKQEELNKGKSLDEMQLLFTKVNMLDDKLTFFNTSFKSKLDAITSLLEGGLVNTNSRVDLSNVNLEVQNDGAFEEDSVEEIDNVSKNETNIEIKDNTEELNTKIRDNLEEVEEDTNIQETINGVETEIDVDNSNNEIIEATENDISLEDNNSIGIIENNENNIENKHDIENLGNFETKNNEITDINELDISNLDNKNNDTLDENNILNDTNSLKEDENLN